MAAEFLCCRLDRGLCHRCGVGDDAQSHVAGCFRPWLFVGGRWWTGDMGCRLRSEATVEPVEHHRPRGREKFSDWDPLFYPMSVPAFMMSPELERHQGQRVGLG